VNDDCDDSDPANVPFSFQACHPEDPQSVLVCLPGDESFPDMSIRPCLSGTWCVPQPNGAGVCQVGGPGTARRVR
jgi:hypothetical protein